MKAATQSRFRRLRTGRFQSTPPVKAATGIAVATYSNDGISIHAAREGGDVGEYEANLIGISIHAAREGGDIFRV